MRDRTKIVIVIKFTIGQNAIHKTYSESIEGFGEVIIILASHVLNGHRYDRVGYEHALHGHYLVFWGLGVDKRVSA